MNKKISVIILNWNGLKFINKCVESVIRQTYSNIEIILVDNNSTDGSLEIVSSLYKIDKLIKNTENLGFSKGMNIGIGNSSGDYVMTLNMDVYLASYAIENIVKYFDKYTDVGIIMGKEFSWINDELINNETISSGPGFLKIRGQGFSDKKNLNNLTFSFGAMGSFPTFRREVLNDLRNNIGYIFDPKFETGWEDKDVFFRTHHLGWKFLYVPEIIGYHSVSGSVNNKAKLIDKSIEYQQRIFRNRYYFIFKNYNSKLLFLHLPFLIFTELTMYPYYLFKNPRSLIALTKARKEFQENIKTIRKDRKKILDESTLSLKEMLSFFKKF